MGVEVKGAGDYNAIAERKRSLRFGLQNEFGYP